MISPHSVQKGFSHSIFTAFVCSYLLRSVPKPLKAFDLELVVMGESVHSGELDCSFYLLLLWGSRHSFSVSCSGLPCQSGGWTMFGIRNMGHGMFWKCACLRSQSHHTFRDLNASSYRLILSCCSAFTFQCELHSREIRCSFCLSPPFPLSVFIKFLQLNTESWLPFNLHH